MAITAKLTLLPGGKKEGEALFYRHELAHAFGLGITATLILGQVMFWYQAAGGQGGRSKLQVMKYGQYWLAKSTKDWQAMLNASPQQVRTAMGKLKAMGLITTMVCKFNGTPTTHIRFPFVSGAKSIKDEAHLIDLYTASICCQQQVHLLIPTNPFVTSNKSLTETTSETTTEITHAAGAAKKKMPKLQDILSSLEEKKKNPPTPLAGAKSGPAAMAMLWKKRLALVNGGGFVKDLTGKQVGQLKLVHKALGDDAIAVLDWCLGHWGQFCHDVRLAKGLHTYPEKPDTGFFCAYYDLAVQSIAVAKSPPAPQSVPSSKPKATEQSQQVSEPAYTSPDSSYLAGTQGVGAVSDDDIKAVMAPREAMKKGKP